MNVFVLAAGLGTRLRPLTNKFPKPCVPFLNVPLGLHIFRYLNNLEFSQLTVNTHYLPDQVKAMYENQPYFTGPVRFSHEGDFILGSAGGLKQASKHFAKTDNENFLLMNSDEVFIGAEADFLKKAYNEHISSKALATIVVMKHHEAGKKFGAVWCDGKTVKTIGKTSADSSLKPYHYIGMIFFNEKVLSLIPENKETNIFYDILNFHMQNNEVRIYEISCDWYETGNPADYLDATQEVLKKVDQPFLGFINRYDPSAVISEAGHLSLVSKSVAVSQVALSGWNVISKTTNPGLLKSLGSVHNSILFENECVNEKYFSKT